MVPRTLQAIAASQPVVKSADASAPSTSGSGKAKSNKNKKKISGPMMIYLFYRLSNQS